MISIGDDLLYRSRAKLLMWLHNLNLGLEAMARSSHALDLTFRNSTGWHFPSDSVRFLQVGKRRRVSGARKAWTAAELNSARRRS
jgi:hypothetical protein